MVLLDISSNTFVIYKNSMRICGIWPMDGLTRKTIILYCVFLLIEIVGTIPYNADIVGSCIANQAGTSRQVSMSWISFLAVLRLTFRLEGRRLTPLIESTIDDWSFVADPTERRIMKRHDRIGTLPFFIIISWAFADPLIPDIISLTLRTTRVTLDDRKICDGNYSLTWSIAMIILAGVLNTLEIISYYGSVLLIWSLAMHLCGQYLILKHRFKEFLLIEKKTERRAKLGHLVDRHNRLIDLSGKFRDSVNVFVTLDLVAEQLLICISAFELGYAIKDSDLMKMAKAVEYLTAITTTVFFYYHMSDYLAGCGEEIGDMLIQYEWNDLSKESITNFSIIIARSQMSTSLSAAKLYKLNHENFKYVLHAMYSYVSLILAITKNEK